MEELQGELDKLLKKLDKSEKDNRDLQKQLRKYGKKESNTPRSQMGDSRMQSDMQSIYSSEDEDDKKSRKSVKSTKSVKGQKNVRIVSEQEFLYEEMHRNKEARKEHNSREEYISQLKVECVNKCNFILKELRYLSKQPNSDEIWEIFEEMDVDKRGDKIQCCKLQKKINFYTTQFKVINETTIWDDPVGGRKSQDDLLFLHDERKQTFGNNYLEFEKNKKQFELASELLECFTSAKQQIKVSLRLLHVQ